MPHRDAIDRQGRVCPYQAAFLLDNWFRRLVQNPRKLLQGYIRAGDTVVDMGCGPGFFTIEMARMVGPAGRVIAVDLQARMLDRVEKKAVRFRLDDRITTHQSRPDCIGLSCRADFILAVYMVHETPDSRQFFSEAKSMLRSSGTMMVVEPKMHVSKTAFDAMVAMATEMGLRVMDTPKGKGGRAVTFTKGAS